MSDHEKLREAIGVCREANRRLWHSGDGAQMADLAQCHDLVIAAAESTLPKMKWKIRACQELNVFESWEWPTLIEFEAHLYWLLHHGYRKIEIEAP